MGRDDDDGDVLVDQRDGPVLQFARRIALGVDVGNFLELQGAFERDRIIDAAAEEQHVTRIGHLAGHLADVLFVLQDFRHVAGRHDEGADEFPLLLRA